MRKAAGLRPGKVNTPGAQAGRAVEILACILHPETFPEAPAAAVRLAYALK